MNFNPPTQFIYTTTSRGVVNKIEKNVYYFTNENDEQETAHLNEITKIFDYDEQGNETLAFEKEDTTNREFSIVKTEEMTKYNEIKINCFINKEILKVKTQELDPQDLVGKACQLISQVDETVVVKTTIPNGKKYGFKYIFLKFNVKYIAKQ